MLGTLKSYELRVINFSDAPMEQAFHTSFSKNKKGKEHVRNYYRDHDHGEGTSKSKDFSNGERSRIPLSEKQCFYCYKYRHTMKL